MKYRDEVQFWLYRAKTRKAIKEAEEGFKEHKEDLEEQLNNARARFEEERDRYESKLERGRFNSFVDSLDMSQFKDYTD